MYCRTVATPGNVDTRGLIYDRKPLLGQLADGVWPEAMYGLARSEAAHEVAGYLAGIRLDDSEVFHHAMANTYMLERRYRAYRAGVRFLHEAYYSYNLVTGPNGDLR